MNSKTPIVSPLYEGTFSVGTDRKFIRIKKTDPPERGALKLSINPFLIQTAERNLLVDAGLGDFGEDTSTEIIKENLDGFGLTEHDITDIFISHLHYDHIGGLAGKMNGYLELTFPDAKLWVSRKDWERLLDADHAPADEARLEFIHFLDAKADLHFLNETDQPYPDVRVKETGGHTEFSQVIFFESGDSRYLMAGDVIGRKSAVQTKYLAKFDFDPKKSMNVREGLKKLAFEEGYVIMAYHETDTPLFSLTGYSGSQGYITEGA